MITRIVTAAVLLGLALAVVSSLPDVARYLKIREM
jgi:hypothetical protein